MTFVEVRYKLYGLGRGHRIVPRLEKQKIGHAAAKEKGAVRKEKFRIAASGEASFCGEMS